MRTVQSNKLDFDPNLPLSKEMGRYNDVLVIPWGTNTGKGYKRSAGIFSSTGEYLEEAVCWRYEQEPATIRPEYDLSQEPELLAGRYIFGGIMYSHFGHFLCESLGRLWALAELDDKIDGIVYFPKPALTWAMRLTKPSLPFFGALGFPELKIIAPQEPIRVEELIIPEQGFGLNEMSAGRPEFRKFMRSNLGKSVNPTGPKKMYISRARLPSKRGSVLMESRLSELLEVEGYETFHPQDHPIDVQIARYKAAEAIISLDASSLHLAAMVVQEDCKVGIINRGPSQNIKDYMRQFHHFANILPTRVDAVQCFWFPSGKRIVKRETHSLIDFRKLCVALREAGFIANSANWQQLKLEEIDSAVDALQARKDIVLQRHELEKIDE